MTRLYYGQYGHTPSGKQYVYYGGDIGKQCEVYTTWLKDYKIECVVYGMNEIILNGYVSYKYAKDNGTFIDWGE